MRTRSAQHLALVPWLSLPAVLISQAVLWDRLPPEVALHFTSSGRPITSTSRAGFLLFSVVTLLVVLAACTLRLRKAGGGSSTGLLLRYYFTVAVMLIIYFGVLAYNVYIRAAR